jgi:hypothetical protein
MAKDERLGDAPVQLSKHLTNINNGGETGIVADYQTMPGPTAEGQKQKVREAIDRIRAVRRKNGRATVEEILLWRDEGRR